MRTNILFIIYLLCICLPGKAQNISFHHLTTDDGLSHNSVVSIYQDERGFMWFGTRNGVSLYNGKAFKIYQKEKDNPNSILYNDIYQIVGDKKGHVFIIGNRGISDYDIKNDTFTHITRNNMRSGFFSGHLYATNTSQILKFINGTFEEVYRMPANRGDINKFYIHNDSIFIGTINQGLYLLTPQRKLIHLIPNGTISDILRDRSGNYWVTDQSGQGVYLIQGKKITNFQSRPNDPTSLSSNFVHRCSEDQQGNIWIGTFNGLNKYDKKTGRFSQYTQQDNKKSLSHSSIWSLYCDYQGNVWVGTYFGGVNYFNPQKHIYHEYQTSSKEKQGLSSPIVSRITEDNQGNIWICTEGGGLNKYNPVTQTYKWYTHDQNSNSLSQNNVRAIYYDARQEILWLGIHLGGLNKLDIRTGKITHYRYKKGDITSIPSDNIEDILPYQGQLILATDNNIGLFNPQTGKCRLLFNNQDALNRTQSTIGLLIDHKGTLWIANNNNGACAYHFDTQKIVSYKVSNAPGSISSNSINSIFEDSQKRLWFCTNENGLNLYREETNDFENFDMRKNGLASNVIYNMCELSPNRLLVTTDKGFSVLDYQQKQFKNYDELPLSCINGNALYKSRKGEIFVGGTSGVISFYEKNLEQAPRSYHIVPYRLTVNGEEINVANNNGILAQDITYTPLITLKAKQNVFSIEYTTTDYILFNKDEVVYRLEGFSNGWNKLGQNPITYTNLNPGTYTLIVKAKGVDEKLVAPSRLRIEILPPFYRTAWAYLLYIICIGLIASYLIRTYYHRIQLQESLKYEQKHIEDIEKLNQAKLRFFTNISHEFRTPLTLIIGQMEMLLQVRSFPPNVYNKILSVYKSCLQLKELVTELLDFRKQEQGYITIKVSEHNIVDFIYEHYLLFQEYAVQRQITFNFEKSSDDIRVWYDARQMQKVMNNLISNAFKHTKKGGTISISIRKRNQEVIIEVTDNGSGIAAKDIDKIFECFYQTDVELSSNTGTGIGLSITKGIVELHQGTIEVSSELGEGTSFCIRLKTGNEHFTSEQICETVVTPPETEMKLNSEILDSLLQEHEPRNNDVKLKEGKYKILIVEDNESLKEMLIQIFEVFYTVITASDGKEGLEKVRSENPNIVLSDIIMPEMSGTELCQAIKKNPDTCHIPVVLLTAKTAIEHNLEGLKMGADDYISKPFNINILLSRCNNLINNRIMLQEKFSKQPQTDMQILATNTLDKKFIDQAMDIIEKKMENGDFNVDQLAAEMGIARTKVYSKFKAITGQTPGELIMTIRLKRAAFLLRNNPELNISEISDQIGFNIPKYFSKCFKEKYHITPLAYRRGDAAPAEDEEEMVNPQNEVQK